MSARKPVRVGRIILGVLGSLCLCILLVVVFAVWEMREREFNISAPNQAVRDDARALELAKAGMVQMGKNPDDYHYVPFYGGKLCGRNESDPDFANVIFFSKAKLEGWSVRLKQMGTQVHCAISPTK